eukprot:3013906-Amphidinium_carterae.1
MGPCLTIRAKHRGQASNQGWLSDRCSSCRTNLRSRILSYHDGRPRMQVYTGCIYAYTIFLHLLRRMPALGATLEES